MFSGQLLPSQDYQKGYVTIDFDYIDNEKMSCSELHGGTCEVDLCPGAYPVCEQVWSFMNKIIDKVFKMTTPLLELSVVTDSQK